MKNATVLIVILALASVTFAGEKKLDKHKAFVMRRVPVEMTVSSNSSVDFNTVKWLSKVSGPRLQKSTQGESFNLPFTSNYDYGWNSGIRDFVDVDADGNVHITAFVSTGNTTNNRHIVYWFNPGESDEFSGVVSTMDGKGWANVQTLSDGRATIVYHVDDKGFLIDAASGLGVFTAVTEPVVGALWMHTQIGIDDVIWYATNHSKGIQDPSDSTLVWFSTNEGTTWTQVTTVHNTGTHVVGPAEPVIRVSMDASKVLVKNEWGGGSIIELDSADQTTYAWSDDNGETWNEVIVTFDPYIHVDGTDTTVIADVFMSAAGTEDTLLVEDLRQTDITFDYLGNVHMVMSGFSFYWDPVALSSRLAFPLLHYSSARGELASNFVEITDTDISHSDWLHNFMFQGLWPGNSLGINYPTISAAPDTSLLLVVWSQPRYINGQIDMAQGFVLHDIWASTSRDLGDNWTAPVKIVDEPGLSVSFPTLAKPLQPTGTPGEYTYHLMYLEDHVPGLWIGTTPENGPGLAQWVYMRNTFSITGIVGIEDEDVISARSFELNQNYPNPFNPSTRIEFALNERSRVTLTVYNMLGQEVATLVDEIKSAGSHYVIWNASDVASGIYFYKFSTGDHTLTKKMVFLK